MISRIITIAVVLVFCVAVMGQTKSFTPVEGANLKAKIESAIVTGKASTPNGRFWLGYQFDVRPGVGVDFEIVDSAGGIYMSMDGDLDDVRPAPRDPRARRVSTLRRAARLFHSRRSLQSSVAVVSSATIRSTGRAASRTKRV